jgi:glycosyltransferase involved in cell wall biosynthesis
MRILYLHQYFCPPSAPGPSRSYEFARRLIANGHQVRMITSSAALEEQYQHTRQAKEVEIAGIPTVVIHVPYANAFGYNARIRAFLRFAVLASFEAMRWPADVVFATSTPLTIALPGVCAARRQRIPMVFEVRDLWPEIPIAIGALKGQFPIAAARWLERFAYKHSVQIVALSPGMRDGIVRTGYPENRVHIIPNAADLDLFDVPPERGQRFRRQFGWLQDRPLVAYTGAIGRANGVDYLARLAAVVQKIAPEVRFLVIGEGGEKRKVQETAKNLGVLGQNFFMMEGMPKVEMPAVLSAADLASSVFIELPELWANSANKFFDALASGTPVAINYRGWQAELLKETEAGIVLDARDIEGAAKSLVQVLEDQSWLDRAGLAARRLAEERFSRDMLAKQLEAVLTKAAR